MHAIARHHHFSNILALFVNTLCLTHMDVENPLILDSDSVHRESIDVPHPSHSFSPVAEMVTSPMANNQ